VRLTDPGVDPRYRIYRVPSDNADRLERALQPYYNEQFLSLPTNVQSYRDLLRTIDAPSDARIQGDLGTLQETFGAGNVAYGEALPFDLYESAPLGEVLRVTAFDESFTVAEDLSSGVTRLDNAGDGEDAILYSRVVVVDGAHVRAGTIVTDSDAIEVTPIDRAGHSIFVRLENAAAAADHAQLSPEQIERRLLSQRRRSAQATVTAAEMPRSDVRGGEGCRVGNNSDTIIVGWIATPPALSVLRTPGFRSVESEIQAFNDALHASGVTGSAKAFPLFSDREEWDSNASIDSVVEEVTSENGMARLWRAANEGCADILLLVTRLPLRTTIGLTDCGAAATVATPNTAAAVVNIECFFATRRTVAHELGHVFGACHETAWHRHPWPTCPRIDLSVTYEHRFAWSGFLPRDRVRQGDVMAHWRSPSPSEGFLRNLHYSDPRKNGPGGTSEMNAAELVQQRFAAVANFYESRNKGIVRASS
jgi:hypothetical protein